MIYQIFNSARNSKLVLNSLAKKTFIYLHVFHPSYSRFHLVQFKLILNLAKEMFI